jgi:hypothetical protein
MGFFAWFGTHWFTLLQSVGIIAGLMFSGLALRLDAKSRRIGNLITLTASHRDIWSQLYRMPKLARVLEPNVNLKDAPITESERLFMTLLILHLSSIYHALDDSLSVKPDALRQDIKELFSLPIPRAVWEEMRRFQDRRFVKFIAVCLGSGNLTGE